MHAVVRPLVANECQRSPVNAAPVRGVPVRVDEGARGLSPTRAILRERIWLQGRLASRSGWQ